MAGVADLASAIVVGMVRYGETSRIVRLATREQGLVAALAKGATRPRSPFPGLQLLAAGTAHLIRGRGELAILSRFDMLEAHRGIAGSLEAFRAANVLAEISSRAFPLSTQEDAFEALSWGLTVLSVAPPAAVDVLALSAVWRMAATLGARPSIDFCAADGRAVPHGAIQFSVEQGGVICGACGSWGGSARLSENDLDALHYFLNGEGDPPLLDRRHLAAHRRLVGRWLRRHVLEGTLPALTQWVDGDDSGAC